MMKLTGSMVVILWISCLVRISGAEELSPARLTVRTLDEEGRPVHGANVAVVSRVDDAQAKAAPVEGVTDAGGKFAAEAASTGEVKYTAAKAGYYEAAGLYRFEKKSEGRWAPWNPTLDLALKKIVNPVPMYAKNVHRVVRATGMQLGYDLMDGDFVAPYGNGKTADLLLLPKFDQKGKDEFDYTLTVSFSNAGDGIQMVDMPGIGGQVAKLPREAPADGYKDKWVVSHSQRLNRPAPAPVAEGMVRVYFVRVRTILDGDGKVKKALYGKMYGEFMNFTHYLNPDGTRNLEFDLKNNLLKGLDAEELVRVP